MLVLTRALLEEINANGVQAYPYEGCGLLLGQSMDGRNVVEVVQPVENRWEAEAEKRARFRIAESDFVKAEMWAAGRGLGVVGIFHSHPDAEPVASARDLAWAAWHGYSYLITEISGGRPGVSRSWQLREDRTGFDEEMVEMK